MEQYLPPKRSKPRNPSETSDKHYRPMKRTSRQRCVDHSEGPCYGSRTHVKRPPLFDGSNIGQIWTRLWSCLNRKYLSDPSAVYNHVCSLSIPPLFAWTKFLVTPRTSSSHTFMRHSRPCRWISEHAQPPIGSTFKIRGILISTNRLDFSLVCQP